MAIIVANPDGTSNAQPGDTVITGGGIFKKTASGSEKVASLSNLIGVGTSKNYDDVLTAYNIYSNSTGNKIGNNSGAERTATANAVKNELAAAEDDNGIVVTGIEGYDPLQYSASSSGASSTGGDEIVGYVVLILVGIALLDRFMNKGGR